MTQPPTTTDSLVADLAEAASPNAFRGAREYAENTGLAMNDAQWSLLHEKLVEKALGLMERGEWGGPSLGLALGDEVLRLRKELAAYRAKEGDAT